MLPYKHESWHKLHHHPKAEPIVKPLEGEGEDS